MLVPRAGSTIHCPEYESCARAWKIERLIVSKIAAATKADNLRTQTVNSFRAKATTVSSSDAIATFENTSGIQMIVRGNGPSEISTFVGALKRASRVATNA